MRFGAWCLVAAGLVSAYVLLWPGLSLKVRWDYIRAVMGVATTTTGVLTASLALWPDFTVRILTALLSLGAPLVVLGISILVPWYPMAFVALPFVWVLYYTTLRTAIDSARESARREETQPLDPLVQRVFAAIVRDRLRRRLASIFEAGASLVRRHPWIGPAEALSSTIASVPLALLFIVRVAGSLAARSMPNRSLIIGLFVTWSAVSVLGGLILAILASTWEGVGQAPSPHRPRR